MFNNFQLCMFLIKCIKISGKAKYFKNAADEHSNGIFLEYFLIGEILTKHILPECRPPCFL